MFEELYRLNFPAKEYARYFLRNLRYINGLRLEIRTKILVERTAASSTYSYQRLMNVAH